ncbi:MAG: hypothetical protein K2X72_35125 [Reyranella sp.]|nr:hypothetical protein [Reyranella sp.]
MSTENQHSESRAPLPPKSVENKLMQLPEVLRKRSQWLLAHHDKAPRLADGTRAKWLDPNTWMDFKTASHVAREQGCHVGYVLTAEDPFTCIDYDTHHSENPELYIPFINKIGTYTERSLSGGFHQWVEGKASGSDSSIQIFSDKRFMICTGDVFLNRPIENREAMVKNMAGQVDDHSAADWGVMCCWIEGCMTPPTLEELMQAFKYTPAGKYAIKNKTPHYIEFTARKALERRALNRKRIRRV